MPTIARTASGFTVRWPNGCTTQVDSFTAAREEVMAYYDMLAEMAYEQEAESAWLRAAESH